MNEDQLQVMEDLRLLLAILPADVRERICDIGREDELLEVVLDLGRVPSARYVPGEINLRDQEVTQTEIDAVVSSVGEFDDDNRAGIARTLHRISAIRNRRGEVVGLTCRVGRAVFGTIDIVADFIEDGESILLLGRPGVGKTTMLREMARVLSDKKRVIVVDTSNEIGGDGDIPHPAVGRARRMQVPKPAYQHEVMIEAVENHNPEVIIIDEIGREREAAAARTINERGVQLIGTAHGNTIENLLLNPTLSDLVGGIESVTLDSMLRGHPCAVELRYIDEQGQIATELSEDWQVSAPEISRKRKPLEQREIQNSGRFQTSKRSEVGSGKGQRAEHKRFSERSTRLLNVYAYGVARNRLKQAAKRLKVSLNMVENLSEADVLVTLKSYFRRQRKLISDAQNLRIPVYVLRANTVTQMEGFLAEAMNLNFAPSDPFEDAIDETKQAIKLVQAGQGSVDLRPKGSAVRRHQHQMARQANLVSHSYGKGSGRHVRIFSTSRNQVVGKEKVHGTN
jgi:stage III sporulation protein SpoIIIAA